MKKAVVINDTRTQLHHGCERVMSVIESELRARNIEVILTAPEGQDWRRNRRVVEAMRRSDIVIVNGEGTIHHGRPAARDLMEVGRFAADAGRPAVLINCSYQDNPTDFAALLAGFEGVWCRESRSALQLEAHGAKPLIVPDLTLSDGAISSTIARSGVALTDSTYASLSLEMYRYARRNGYAFLPVLRSRRFENAIDPVEWFRGLLFYTRRLVMQEPHEDEVDEGSYLRLRNIYLKPSVASFVRSISSYQLVITARFHALCFCLVTGTPFVALASNSHKIEGMLEDIGCKRGRLTDKSVLHSQPDLGSLEFDDRERGAIDAYLLSAVDGARSMFDSIARLSI